MKRRTTQLSESLQRKLNAYALAASAAGVGILASAQPAEARIVYTKTDCLFGAGQGHSCEIDLLNNGVSEFGVRFTTRQSGGQLVLAYMYQQIGRADRIEVAESSHSHCGRSWAAALREGAPIRGGHLCGSVGPFLMLSHYTTSKGRSFNAGEWKDVTNRYLGFRFVINNGWHYGWARVRVKLDVSGNIEGALTGYAYESVPLKPIIAGKTHGKDGNAVQPVSLGTLAAGATALSTRRHEQGANK
jgi:hypothetical protein